MDRSEDLKQVRDCFSTVSSVCFGVTAVSFFPFGTSTVFFLVVTAAASSCCTAAVVCTASSCTFAVVTTDDVSVSEASGEAVLPQPVQRQNPTAIKIPIHFLMISPIPADISTD